MFFSLYDLERGYIKDHLPPDEIKRQRNGLETTEIIGSIWMELTRLLDADKYCRSDEFLEDELVTDRIYNS